VLTCVCVCACLDVSVYIFLAEEAAQNDDWARVMGPFVLAAAVHTFFEVSALHKRH
jgi:hypothetical protein